MRVFEVFKPTFNARIEIRYDFLDTVASGSTSLCTDIILKLLKTFRPYIATAIFKPIP